MPTPRTLIKRRHGLIRTSNLDHIKVSSIPATIPIRALRLGVVDVVPGALAAHHVVDGFPLHRLALVVSPRELEFVGAGRAGEAVVRGGGGAGDLEWGGY